MSKCRYCGADRYGASCPFSPSKCHEHIETHEKCEFCGSKEYGTGCIAGNPHKKHRHGHARGGAGICRWCGKSVFGHSCLHSPSGVHER